MRLLVTGGRGQLARALAERGVARGLTVRALGSAELDIRDRAAIEAAMLAIRPDWVLHCAAATKVDRCESEVEWAHAVNEQGAANVAAACRQHGARLLHYSTDFVFDGAKSSPYVESDATAPLSVYGRSKLAGEERVLAVEGLDAVVVRTQWVYGPGGRCFPAAILERAKTGQSLRVVDDQTGCPTMTLDLAEASLDLVDAVTRARAEPGVYHASNRGPQTWWDFATAVLAASGFGEVDVARISSDELDLPAARPPYSVLDCAKIEAAIGRSMPSVESGLETWLEREATVRGSR